MLYIYFLFQRVPMQIHRRSVFYSIIIWFALASVSSVEFSGIVWTCFGLYINFLLDAGVICSELSTMAFFFFFLSDVRWNLLLVGQILTRCRDRKSWEWSVQKGVRDVFYWIDDSEKTSVLFLLLLWPLDWRPLATIPLHCGGIGVLKRMPTLWNRDCIPAVCYNLENSNPPPLSSL